MLKQKEIQRIEALRFFKYGPFRGDVAIDGGAHVGSWTVHMADNFKHVLAFEPCIESFEALRTNTADLKNVNCYQTALGDKNQFVDVYAPKGRTTLTARKVRPGGDVKMLTIDSLDLISCDFIKLDLEGYELKALEGAKETIQKFSPHLVIEMNEEQKTLEFLSAFGYKEQWRDGVDWGFKK